MKKIIHALGFSILLSALAIDTNAQDHKKMSHRKKDALIGAGGGAVAGAVVSHHKGKGAVIGGAVGATAGYLHGRHKDKQNGTLKK